MTAVACLGCFVSSSAHSNGTWALVQQLTCFNARPVAICAADSHWRVGVVQSDLRWLLRKCLSPSFCRRRQSPDAFRFTHWSLFYSMMHRSARCISLTCSSRDSAYRPALALTWVQFAFIAIEGFAHHVLWGNKTRKTSRVSWRQWLSAAIMHFSVSALNNLSLEYEISVPMHIVLRSGGGLVTLGIGALVGKRYSKTKWIAVMAMTLGIIFVALDNLDTLVRGLPICSLSHPS